MMLETSVQLHTLLDLEEELEPRSPLSQVSALGIGVGLNHSCSTLYEILKYLSGQRELSTL